jgi:hypothetical protein
MTSDRRKQITKLVVWGAVAAWAIWELIVVYYGDYKALITPYVKQVRGFPLMVVVVGILLAHFVLDLTQWGWAVKQMCIRQPWIPLLVGVLLGMTLWPSKR